MKKIFLSLIQINLLCISIISIGCSYSYGQVDTAMSPAIENLSLRELLNVKIVSASKNSEFLFDAPLSASVVTKEEIRKAGCTSIMEAMRLVPGMIVREQSNGNYDIHLRGMDNVPPNAPFDMTSNTTTLVMIDGRPVYSYLRGGTFWETLPIDLNDVERIEVVRGPAAALYGPNAVNGVINIITRQPQKDGLFTVVNARQGSDLTFCNNASIGYRFNKKFNMVASGNYQSRDRTQTSYYEFNRNKYLDSPDYFLSFQGDTITNIYERYPDPPLSVNKYAGNVFLNYENSEKTKISFSAGAQNSVVQKVTTENQITPFSTASSVSKYADLRANVKGFSSQIYYNGGAQATDYDPGRKYDFNILGGNVEYSYVKGNFTVKPGLSYTSAVYDDRMYSDLIDKTGIFNGRGVITTKSASLRTEYKLLHNKLRLIAGVGGSAFNYPDTTYLSYEFAATYKLNKKHLLRAVYSRAPRSSNIFDTYVTKSIAFYQSGYKKFTSIALEGNENPKLLTADMFEIGYRGIITSNLNIDVELFDINAENYNTPVQLRPYIQMNGTDTIEVVPITSTNLPLKLQQLGATISLTYSLKKIQIKPFITIQQTKAKDYAPFLNTPDAGTPTSEQYNIYSGIGTTEVLKSTPAVFGGASINYILTSKININLSAYYYSSQEYYHVSNIIFNDGIRGIDHINSKLILNSNIIYTPMKGMNISCGLKNMLNDKSREFYKTDIVPFSIYGGINYEF